MDTKKLIFYNHFHNGDIFTSKGFYVDVIRQLQDTNIEVSLQHFNNPKTVIDAIDYGGPPEAPVNARFVHQDTNLYVNIWLGIYDTSRYPDPPYFYDCGIHMPSLYGMWGHIYEKINSFFGTNLVLDGPFEKYLPSINFSAYDNRNVEDFLESRKNRKRVLFSNGIPMAGQSFSSNMEELINLLAAHYSDIDFFVTAPIDVKHKNIFYTGDITRMESDLNEIAYLGKYCNLIVGKNSGPFIFCVNKENIMDKTKTFVSFNIQPRDSMIYNVNKKCTYDLHWTTNYQEIANIVAEKVKLL
jgi:hypothetical protein